MSISSS